MKKLYYSIVLALILGLTLTGCTLLSNISQVPTTEQSGITYLTKGTAAFPDVSTLYAGQHIDAGTVSVWNDFENLYVKYETTGNWVMTETHLAVVTDKDEFPTTNKGNPKVGHFPYQCCYDEDEEEWSFVRKPDTLTGTCDAGGTDLLTEITYTIPLESGWVPNTPLLIAAHASLLNLLDTVDVYANEPTPICSDVILESGKKYLLKASGTAFACATIEFDAKYSITGSTGDTWTDLVTGYTGYGPNLLGLAVDGDFVDWGVYNDAHVYYWNMDGTGFCVLLWIYDLPGSYGNNSGFLTVDLYQEESAWAGNAAEEEIQIPFSGKNWATYFEYTVEAPDTLVLYEKDPIDWSIIVNKGELKYYPSGSTFDFVFSAEELNVSTDYSLIYYADPWPGDGVTHSTGALIATMTTESDGSVSIFGSVELGTDLPNSDDYNASGPCECDPCPGAKIWLVLSNHYSTLISGDQGYMTGWDPANYLFEGNSILYDDTDI